MTYAIKKGIIKKKLSAKQKIETLILGSQASNLRRITDMHWQQRGSTDFIFAFDDHRVAGRRVAFGNPKWTHVWIRCGFFFFIL